jgi:hypothetical protein
MRWKKIRRFLIIILSIGLIVFGLVFIDLVVTRGLGFAAVIDYDGRHFVDVPDQDPNVIYEITPLANGRYNFRFENNAFTPKFLTVYRNDDVRYELNDTVFFSYASRPQLFFEDTVIASVGSWGCGTGLGPVTVNPFEVFEIEYTYEELLASSFWELRGCFYGEAPSDLIYHQRFLKDSNDLWIKIDPETSVIPKTDSIAVNYNFYLRSVVDNERYMVSSNTIQLNYLDLLNVMIYRENEDLILYRN